MVVKKRVKATETAVESSGSHLGVSKIQQMPLTFNASSITSGSIGERPKSWSGVHVPR